jgi:hypothetical protein
MPFIKSIQKNLNKTSMWVNNIFVDFSLNNCRLPMDFDALLRQTKVLSYGKKSFSDNIYCKVTYGSPLVRWRMRSLDNAHAHLVGMLKLAMHHLLAHVAQLAAQLHQLQLRSFKKCACAVLTMRMRS